MAVSVLIVEDERIVAMDLANRLRNLGLSVVGNVSSGEEARRGAAEFRPDVILMDIHIKGDEDGVATATRIEKDLGIPSVYITAYSDHESIQRAKASHAYGYLLKPFQDRELQIAIELAIYKYAAETELRSTRNLLRTTLNAIDYGVITVDRENVILFINNHAEKLTGWNRDEARGEPFGKVFHFHGNVSDIPSGEAIRPGSYTLIDRSGTEVPVEVNVHQLDAAGPGTSAYVIMFYDISDKLARETSLIEAKEAAEATARAKSDFFSRISHELRTPLNAILGMAHLLRQNDSREHADEYTQILLQSTENLNGLISDVLDFNASDAAAKGGIRERCELHDLIQDALVAAVDTADEKKLRLLSVIDPALPGAVLCRSRYLRRILHHLVSNACKFTEEGSISVIIEREGSAQSAVIPLVLKVRDTGAGIPAEAKEKIFEEFTQLQPPETRTVGGAGLGLAIVRRLVDAMGGSVAIESVAGGGTTVFVRFTVESTAEGSLLDRFRRRALDEGLRERSGPLGVTDDALLEVIGPWAAACGTEVISVSPKENIPDRIDRLLTTAEDTGILTGTQREGIVVRRRGVERGVGERRNCTVFDEPVDPWSLFRIATGTLPSSDTDASERIPVLLVDDDGISLFLTKRALELRGCDVTVVRRGALALEEIRKKRFSVACIDIEMPEMTGWALARRIREDEEERNRPAMSLIAVTGHSPVDIQETAGKHGFAEVVGKPVDGERLYAAIRRHARTVRAGEHRKTEDAGGDSKLTIRDIVGKLEGHLRREELVAGQALVEEAERLLSSPRHRETLFRIKLALRSKDGPRALILIDELKR